MGQEALQQRDYERANTVFEELLLSRPTGITHYTASALLMLSRVAIGQKDYRRALALLNTESMGIYRQLGDKWGESLTWATSGLSGEQEGNYHEARAFIVEVYALAVSWVINVPSPGDLSTSPR